MDIDIVEVSEDKKEKWLCYYCKLLGHLKKDCWKRMADEAKGKKLQTQVHQVKVIDKEKEDVHTTIRKSIKGMKDTN
jgi:hypothetical protein